MQPNLVPSPQSRHATSQRRHGLLMGASPPPNPLPPMHRYLLGVAPAPADQNAPREPIFELLRPSGYFGSGGSGGGSLTRLRLRPPGYW